MYLHSVLEKESQLSDDSSYLPFRSYSLFAFCSSLIRYRFFVTFDDNKVSDQRLESPIFLYPYQEFIRFPNYVILHGTKTGLP